MKNIPGGKKFSRDPKKLRKFQPEMYMEINTCRREEIILLKIIIKKNLFTLNTFTTLNIILDI